MLMIVGSLLLLVAAIFGLVLLINAFKQGIGPGIMCMFVPFYMLYFAFAKYTSPKKGLVLGGWLGGSIVGAIVLTIGMVSAATDAAEALQAGLDQDWQVAGAPGAEDTAAGAAADEGRTVSCNLSSQPGRICNQYSVTNDATQTSVAEHCNTMQMIVPEGERLALAEGPCPTENAIAKCEPRFGSTINFYYRDPDPDIDNDAAMNSMETMCTGTFTRF